MRINKSTASALVASLLALLLTGCVVTPTDGQSSEPDAVGGDANAAPSDPDAEPGRWNEGAWNEAVWAE